MQTVRPIVDDDPCELLPWDSQFFGIQVARVRGDRMDERRASFIDEWCAERKVALLYCLARADDAITPRAAESHGYRLVDVRMTFERSITPQDSDPADAMVARLWGSMDVPALQRIAKESYRDTRFHFDDRITSEQADALYGRWIQVSCDGYAKAVLVIGAAGAPEGYISCHLDRERGSIGLVGVDAQVRGRAVGASLVRRALQWFAKQRVERVSVVTQARNVAAQRLYQRCGFLTRQVELYYHKWFDGAGVP